MIRFVTGSDVEKFIQCYIQVFETLYNLLPEDYVSKKIAEASTPDFLQKVQGLVDSSNNILLISQQNETVTGMAWGSVKKGAAWLGFMGVKEPFRGKGVGRSLLNRFIAESIARGAGKVSLDTDPSLVPAIRLYESEDFSREGTVMNPHGMELILFSKNLL